MSEFLFDCSHDPARRYFEIARSPAPAGASTQWLSFCFRSDGMFSRSPGSHFAIALLARFDRDAAGVPVRISGRGMTLGDTSLAVPPDPVRLAHGAAFGGARGAQIESFWFGGNHLFGDGVLCDEPLQDGVDYRVHLHARTDRWVACWFADAEGAPVPGRPAACVRDLAAHPVEPACSGVIIALGRGAQESGTWSARFTEIRHGWF